jgi:hypothetical protein
MADDSDADNDAVLKLGAKAGFLGNLCDAQQDLGASGIGSKVAMKQATFNQVFRLEMKPGEVVTDATRDLFMVHLKITKREFMKFEREFKADNPRYDPTAADFNP